MGERRFIASIERALRSSGERVTRSVGDDAAVVRARPFAVTSLDTIVDGVHFRLETHSHADVGHKALGAALSDLAAMGAEPGEAYVALALPRTTSTEQGLELVAAMDALAARAGAAIAGGDVVASPLLVASVTVTGWVEDAGELVYRDGAAAGELVGVSGALGGGGAGLLLLEGVDARISDGDRRALIDRHRRPEPRLALGRALAAAGVTAMIDVSDGVATDAEHVADRSDACIELRLGDLPLADGVVEVARAAGRDPLELAATAGEDYELLVTAPPERRRAIDEAARSNDSTVTWIGEVRSGRGLRLLGADGAVVQLAGYEHRLTADG